MPIQIHWEDDAQTVVRCEFRSPWTWDELFSTMEEVKAITDVADHEVGAILDVSEGVTIPGGLFNPQTLENAKKMIKIGEGGSGPVVVVGTSPMIKMMYNVAQTINREAMANFSFAETVDQARQILAEKLAQ
jgi:hypothetical protein